jgi:hypothetical protein
VLPTLMVCPRSRHHATKFPSDEVLVIFKPVAVTEPWGPRVCVDMDLRPTGGHTVKMQRNRFSRRRRSHRSRDHGRAKAALITGQFS